MFTKRDVTKEIYTVISGSRAYGTATETSDVDTRGIVLRDETSLLSPFGYPETSKGEGDTVYYELRKFLNLATNQNPNILEILWVPEVNITKMTEAGSLLRSSRDKLLSKRLLYTFRGFADSQLKQIISGHTRTGQRAEMQNHGWDTKHGMHAVRVLQMGIEALYSGSLEVSRSNSRQLLAVRRGEYEKNAVIEWIITLKDALEEAALHTTLPDGVDVNFVEELCVQVTHLGWRE